MTRMKLDPRPLWLAVVAAAILVAAPAAAEEAHFGIRAGASVNPDQLVVGGHILFPPIGEHIDLIPNADIGFGDDVTTVTVNGDVRYRFVSYSSVKPYVGAGFTAAWYDGNGESGLSLFGGGIVGRDSANPIMLEMKVGLGNAPDVKFMLGINL